MRYSSIAIVILLACSLVLLAEAKDSSDNWCREGLFTHDSEFEVATVSVQKGERHYYYEDDEQCPTASSCKRKAYLVQGDTVLLKKKRHEGFACTWYTSAAGTTTVGWTKASGLKTKTTKKAALEEWTGMWHYHESTLLITRKKDTLAVQGDTLWHGFGDNVHIGEIQASAKPLDGKLRLESDLCEVEIELISPFLVVRDNFKCGGVNTTFHGVYLKKSK